MPVQSEEENQIMELRLEAASPQSILGNIYVGQVENIAANIQAAFVLIAPWRARLFSHSGSGACDLCLWKSPWKPPSPGRSDPCPGKPGCHERQASSPYRQLKFHRQISGPHNRGKEIRPFPASFPARNVTPFLPGWKRKQRVLTKNMALSSAPTPHRQKKAKSCRSFPI